MSTHPHARAYVRATFYALSLTKLTCMQTHRTSDGMYAWIVDPNFSEPFSDAHREAAEAMLLSPRPTKSQVWVSNCQSSDDDHMALARDIILRDIYAKAQLVYFPPPE